MVTWMVVCEKVFLLFWGGKYWAGILNRVGNCQFWTDWAMKPNKRSPKDFRLYFGIFKSFLLYAFRIRGCAVFNMCRAKLKLVKNKREVYCDVIQKLLFCTHSRIFTGSQRISFGSSITCFLRTSVSCFQ